MTTNPVAARPTGRALVTALLLQSEENDLVFDNVEEAMRFHEVVMRHWKSNTPLPAMADTGY